MSGRSGALFVSSNRTGIIDKTVGAIRNHKIAFTGYGNKKLIIQTHLQDMVPVELPEQPAKWVKLTGDDHFFHAVGYLLHSLRVHDYIMTLADEEERQMASIFGLMPTVPQSEAGLNYRTRVRSPSVLGLG
ncbi:hypothetical protein [Mesorhizobium sp. L103C131B0]|uniref:hypothetical protein n=1 Tax=Mesorhizobium sp. L103C131B0 TaxID=1287089 RepID=UPI0003D01AEE|nr:hypothetical protein [Mesorhizobium sp. L103C131B0]ESZ61974.1 hypothetical protein X729_12965 [Mesorhizobium sp. L103C131B0]